MCHDMQLNGQKVITVQEVECKILMENEGKLKPVENFSIIGSSKIKEYPDSDIVIHRVDYNFNVLDEYDKISTILNEVCFNSEIVFDFDLFTTKSDIVSLFDAIDFEDDDSLFGVIHNHSEQFTIIIHSKSHEDEVLISNILRFTNSIYGDFDIIVYDLDEFIDSNYHAKDPKLQTSIPTRDYLSIL